MLSTRRESETRPVTVRHAAALLLRFLHDCFVSLVLEMSVTIQALGRTKNKFPNRTARPYPGSKLPQKHHQSPSQTGRELIALSSKTSQRKRPLEKQGMCHHISRVSQLYEMRSKLKHPQDNGLSGATREMTEDMYREASQCENHHHIDSPSSLASLIVIGICAYPVTELEIPRRLRRPLRACWQRVMMAPFRKPWR